MKNDTNSSKPSLVKSSSTNTPFGHEISRRKLLSTLALGSTALGAGVMGTGVLGMSKLGMSKLGMSKLGTAVVSMSGEGRLASLISGSTPNADSPNFHDTLFSPALAQTSSEFLLSFGGEGQSSRDVTFTIVTLGFNSGQVRTVGYSSTVVDGTEPGVIPIGWEAGSSLIVAQTETAVKDGVGLRSRVSIPLVVFEKNDATRVEGNGVAQIRVEALSGSGDDIADTDLNVDSIAPKIAPKVITGTSGGQVTILPVLYRAGAELAYTVTDGFGDVESFPSDSDYEGKLFFAGYYVRLHDGAAGWQYVPTAGGVTKDMKLEVPIVLGGEVQFVTLADKNAPLFDESSKGFLDQVQTGTSRYDSEMIPLLPASETRTDFDAALDSAIVGQIALGGGDRLKDSSALVAFLNPPVATTPTPAPGTTPTTTPTSAPASGTPTAAPEQLTAAPTDAPEQLTAAPTDAPEQLTAAPTAAPEQLTAAPTDAPEQLTAAPTDAPEQLTAAPTSAPASGTPTAAPSAAPTIQTTANAIMAATTTGNGTTTLVSTTVAVTTATNSTPATAITPTTTGGTTLVSPTIAGDLSVRGAINAQGSIGGNVARSLSGRLSTFRNRNRNQTGRWN